MAKTAEDWAKEMAYEPYVKSCALSYKEFAAQEVEAFKERLKLFISREVGANQSSHLLTESQINHVIDAVK